MDHLALRPAEAFVLGSARAIRPQIRRAPFWRARRHGRLRTPNRTQGATVPSPERGLLARLDALVALVADRHGLARLPDGRLAAAEARVVARAAGLAQRPRSTQAGPGAEGPVPGRRGLAAVERDAVELLRVVAEGVGLLRVRGDRLEATSLRHAWTQIDESLRAGLTFAAWCQQVTLTGWRLALEEAGSLRRDCRRRHSADHIHGDSVGAAE
jgi:hypothetical protein